ncbi:hypothetical protein C8Q74DRAFT_1365901 [Fomes fomentarius]|nr:hypothetical protein C8Q74DRAFT_1365901 [Fomes fomentarius]
MNTANLENRITLVTGGTDTNKIRALVPSRPFTQQEGTYETLGLVGEKLPWKQEIHVIRVSLSDAHTTYGQTTQTARYGTKVAEALRAWDARRGGPWNVAFFLTNLSSDVDLPLNTTIHQLERTVQTRPNTHIPTLNKASLLIDSNTNTPEDIEDWEERVSSIFEWVGMAALGSQRLSAADRCDPYIAVYTPPERSYIEELTVMRWTAGLVPSTFVQAVLDTIM